MLFKKLFFVWLWREQDVDPESEYLRHLGRVWEIWSKKRSDSSPGLGRSVGFISVFESDLAAKAEYEAKKRQVYFDGGTLSFMVVKAITQKGAAENAMAGEGDVIDRYVQDHEVARKLTLEKWNEQNTKTCLDFLSILRELELKHPQYSKYEFDCGTEASTSARFDLQRKIDGYVRCGAASQEEVVQMMKERGYPFYRIELEQSDIPVALDT